MKTIVLTYDEANSFAKKMIEVMLASGSFSLEKKKKGKSELQKSIEEAHQGKYFVAKDAEDLISQCLS